MKTLKDLTPELRAKIKEYKAEARKFYDGSVPFNRSLSAKYIEFLYKKINKPKPVVIFAKNIKEYKYFFELLRLKPNIIQNAYVLKNKGKVKDSQLDNKLNSKLYSELDSELDSKLNSELYSELDSKLYSELDSKLNSELDSKLYSELYSELDSKLYSELDSELDSKLYSELDSKLDSKLYSELDSKLNSELDSKLIIKLYSELYSELDSELRSQLNRNKTRSHYLWICSSYTRCYLAWYHFIHKQLGVSYSNSKMLDTLYHAFNKTDISRCYFAKGYVLVLRNPINIKFNENNVLHSTDTPSYEFREGEKAYHVNGRKIEEDIFLKSQTIEEARECFNSTNNEDIKAAIITIVKENQGQQGLMDMLNAVCIDEQVIEHSNSYSETLKLYKTKESYPFLQDHHGNMNQPYCWSEMTCPSTGSTYLIDNSAAFDDAVEAAKFLRPSFIPMDLDYNWEQFAN